MKTTVHKLWWNCPNEIREGQIDKPDFKFLEEWKFRNHHDILHEFVTSSSSGIANF